MLRIIIPGAEYFDERTCEFTYEEDTVLELEHSLVSISKWEEKWKIPYLENDEDKPKTQEQMQDYIKMMTLTPNVDDEVYNRFTLDNYREIEEYIKDKHTATWFREDPNEPKNTRVITSELIYYWMIANEIPFECQYWHIERLMTLIRVCSVEKAPPKKMSQEEAMAQHRALNAARRAKH